MATVAGPQLKTPKTDNNDGPATSKTLENGTNSSTTGHHVKNKERKYDLNSFTALKVEADHSDDDDKPLSVRKQKTTGGESKENNCLPNRTSNSATKHSSSNNKHVGGAASGAKKHSTNENKPDAAVAKKSTGGQSEATNKTPNSASHDSSTNDKSTLLTTDTEMNESQATASDETPPTKKKRLKTEPDDEDDLSLAERSRKSKEAARKDEKLIKKEEKSIKKEKSMETEEKSHKKEEKSHKNEEISHKKEEKSHKREEKSSKKRKIKEESEYDEESEQEEKSKKKHAKVIDAKPVKPKKGVKEEKQTGSPRKNKKKEEEQHEVWKWWEEEKKDDGIKWKFLEHKGPLFAPIYVPLPGNIKFYYDGKHVKLSEEAEEVATFYSKMLEHDYTKQEAFNKNFFKDWRKVMTAKEKELISDLKKCDFKEMHEYFMKISEERRNRSKEEKLKEKAEKDEIQKEYGVVVMDGHKEKIGNFRIEPPGLFRGRGTHPKMGMLKKRTWPEDVIINCSKDSKTPVPPAGHKWKEIRHDNTVTWLASWSENIMGSIKYVMLNPSSKIKGEKDWQKYEVARKLKTKVEKIRATYQADFKSKEMKVRQRAVAMYFIDKLALRAGNEKEEGETADTVGCCSLRCEHIKLSEEPDEKEDKKYVVEFDFLGKDSIRYYNRVAVEKRVFRNLNLFMENKEAGDDLFDRLNTTILNKHLQGIMDGLTAKVFRTYNASFTLQEQLNKLTSASMSLPEKILSYNRANREVAVLCNHQRSVPKAHSKQMEALKEKIDEKAKQVKGAKSEYKDAKKAYKSSKSDRNKKLLEQKERQYERLADQLKKLELKATDKEENKEISLGTSKLNYLDPRISVAWCKKWNVPIEKVYNKTQREKFRWAIDMAGSEFVW